MEQGTGQFQENPINIGANLFSKKTSAAKCTVFAQKTG
jgi:hypothetical protein